MVGFLDFSFAPNILRSVVYHDTSSRYIVQILHIIILGTQRGFVHFLNCYQICESSFVTETGSGEISLDFKCWHNQKCFLFLCPDQEEAGLQADDNREVRKG